MTQELRDVAAAIAAHDAERATLVAERNRLILELHAAGHSLRAIAADAGVSYQAVKNVIDGATERP